MTRFIALALCLLLSATSAAAHGGDDHDHEEEAEVAAPGGARLEVAGSNIELVAAIAGRELKIYVDRQATNEPICLCSRARHSDGNWWCAARSSG